MIPTEVSTEELRSASRDLTAVTQQTDGMLRGFLAEIQALGQCWGNDELGMAIGAIYEPVLDMVMDCYESNLDTLDGYAERLFMAADIYDETDAAAAATLDAVRAGASSIQVP